MGSIVEVCEFMKKTGIKEDLVGSLIFHFHVGRRKGLQLSTIISFTLLDQNSSMVQPTSDTLDLELSMKLFLQMVWMSLLMVLAGKQESQEDCHHVKEGICSLANKLLIRL